MIKASELKQAFEREASVGVRVTPFGRRVGVTYQIHIGDAMRNTSICLLACEIGTCNRWVVVRSYPMSYKAAHRLVCSL